VIRSVPDDRWREAGALFHELVELNEPTRSERLARIGDTDPELRAAVEALLAADASAEAALPVPGFGLGPLSDAEPTDALGLTAQTIGRFRVLEQIAWGGMGVVYRAEDAQLQRTVALKFPLLDRGVSDSARATILREARAAGALDHPNLCPIYDIGESSAGPFFVMPLYRGETLKDRIARAAPLSVSEALAILEQLAAGLACAHTKGIIHCDIKPGNIVLLPDGTVKLLDFGLARAIAADASAAEPLIGTVAYMSPEQLRREPVDARADLWAMGVILYEMLCGGRPFVGDGARKIADAVLASEPPRLGTRGVVVPAAVQDLVNTLLAKDPRSRMQTAAELARATAAARHGVDRAPSRLMTRRRIAAAAGVGAAVGLVAIWLSLRSPATLIGSGKLAWGDTIVLADFQVPGPDSANAPALNNVLRGGFGDSKAVSLMPSGDVSSALKRMGRPAGTAISPDVAREIAQRKQLRAVLSGSISPLGTGYLVTLRLTEPRTGNELALSNARATRGEPDLLSALAQAGGAIRRAIGEAPRAARVAPAQRRGLLTTTSLDAARLVASINPSMPNSERIALLRQATRLDTAFAYAWMSIGNMLSWNDYRGAERDSAFTMAYRFRDNLPLMERAQVSHFYWSQVQRDRRRAITELQSALALDTTIDYVVPLNLLLLLVETRQFEYAETFGRQIERWKTAGPGATGDLVRAQVALGKYTAAESTIARRRSLRGASDLGSIAPERLIQLSQLHFDSAEVILHRMLRAEDQLAALSRLRGNLPEAHRLEARVDSKRAADAAAVGARFDSMPGLALTLAREALWLVQDSAAAIAHLDRQWATSPPIHDIQDRIEGMQAAALYAAAGRPARARSLIERFDKGADTIAKRAIYEHQQAALAEIAVAEGNFTEAMQRFRASDLAADGLPAGPCAVCVLPHLARVAERAGWSDSARVFWEAYVSRPAIERLSTDQWFLASAYASLARIASTRRDREAEAMYGRALVELHRRGPRGR